jgi:hypothetical protein
MVLADFPCGQATNSPKRCAGDVRIYKVLGIEAMTTITRTGNVLWLKPQATCVTVPEQTA